MCQVLLTISFCLICKYCYSSFHFYFISVKVRCFMVYTSYTFDTSALVKQLLGKCGFSCINMCHYSYYFVHSFTSCSQYTCCSELFIMYFIVFTCLQVYLPIIFSDAHISFSFQFLKNEHHGIAQDYLYTPNSLLLRRIAHL